MQENNDHSRLQCHFCGSQDLRIASDYSNYVRVTSDCKPWRKGGILALCLKCSLVQTVTTAEWQREADEIYRHYTIYHQSGGTEQSTFVGNEGTAILRSDLIVQMLHQNANLPGTGTLLDVGCGNGSFLRAFSKAFPKWHLFGTEVDRKYEEQVRAIPNFKELFTCDLNKIEQTFDLVSLIHVLEHIPSPKTILHSISGKLRDKGRLLIEVPDCSENPFMLLVADHCSHFSPPMLASIIGSAGFNILKSTNQWVQKEITLLAEKNGLSQTSISAEGIQQSSAVFGSHEWLRTVIKTAEGLAERKNFGIFGSSIAATWLNAQIGNKTVFFVDEDPNRLGKYHMNVPILPPATIPRGATVFVALPPAIAVRVASRLRSIGDWFEVHTPQLS